MMMKRLFDAVFLKEYKEDPNRMFVNTILNHVDYKRSVVGGSYALKTLLQANWDYNDVDIFVECENIEDFDAETTRVQDAYNKYETRQLKLVKERLPTDEVTEDELDKVERFHECIIKTRNYDTDPPTKPIQFVGIQKGYWRFKGHFEAGLCDIVDAPSVFMKYGVSMAPVFIVPSTSMQAIFTKEINEFSICTKRAEKYAQRGFNIVKPST
jgi:hypothetical protein